MGQKKLADANPGAKPNMATTEVGLPKEVGTSNTTSTSGQKRFRQSSFEPNRWGEQPTSCEEYDIKRSVQGPYVRQYQGTYFSRFDSILNDGFCILDGLHM